MGIVIAGAKQLGLWDGWNGAWDIPQAIQLYENVQHFFKYPSQTTPVGMIRSAGGLFTICTWRVAQKQKITGKGHRDQGKGGAGIRVMEEANKAEIGEVNETNDTDVEME